MNKKRKSKLIISLVLVLAVAILGTSISVFSNELFIKKTDAYVFPITPDNTEEWRKLQSLDEKIEVCQVPEDILKNMSTEGLLETCFNYPLYINLVAYNSLQQGFDSLCTFNGLQELLNRPDAGKCILKYYKNLDLGKLAKNHDAPTLHIIFIETLLSQDAILSNMEQSKRSEVLDVSINKAKTKRNKFADIYAERTSAFLIGRVLKKDNPDFKEYLKKNEKIKKFIDKGENVNVTQEEWDGIVKKFGYLGKEK